MVYTVKVISKLLQGTLFTISNHHNEALGALVFTRETAYRTGEKQNRETSSN